jgi:hypothetical protein
VASWRLVARAPRPPHPAPSSHLHGTFPPLTSRNHLPSPPPRSLAASPLLPNPLHPSLSRRRAPCLPLPPHSPPRPPCSSPAAGSRGFSSSRSAHPPSPHIARPPPPVCGPAASPGPPGSPPSPPPRCPCG